MKRRPPPKPPMSKRVVKALGGWLTPALVVAALLFAGAALDDPCFNPDCSGSGELAFLLVIGSVAVLAVWCVSWLIRGAAEAWRKRR